MRLRSVLIAIGAATLVLVGCAGSPAYTSPEYLNGRADQVKHVAVVVRHTAAVDEVGAQLFGRTAYEYLAQHNTVLVHDFRQVVESFDLSTLCRFDGRELDGILLITPRRLAVDEFGAEVAAAAALVDCPTRKVLWSRRAGTSYGDQAHDLPRVEESVTGELGEDVRPFVGPVFLLTARLLDGLGEPKLTEEESDERIELHHYHE